jgi:hypothetical protein
MSSEDRIEILIEAENKASAAIKSVVNDLKGVKEAVKDAGSAEGLAKITSELKTLEAQVKATAKALGSLTENAGSSASRSNIAESIRAQNEAYKELATTVARQAKAYDEANKLRIAGNEAARASDKTLADSIVNQAKSYDEINKLRIAGNNEAWKLDKQRAVAIENQAKAEAVVAKQTAAEYAKINELRLKGNQGAWDQYSKDQAADQVAKVKEVARVQADAAKQAKEGARDQANAIKGVQKATESHGITLGEVSGLVQRVFASYLVYQFAGAIKNTTSAVLEWMGSIETYGIALASSLQVGGNYVEKNSGRVLEGVQAFKVAQRDAAGVMEALQVANFQTVATLEQLIRMYQEALPIAMSKGFDKKMVQDFTLSVTQAASAMGVSLDMMAEEARSLLTGAINLRNSRVAVALGITPEDIRANSANANQLFQFLMGKLQVYRMAGEEIQNSWRGLWSNFKDIMMQAGGKALEPLFEGIKQQLKDVIDSIVTLDKEAGKIIWNPAFLDGINTIKSGLVEIMNMWTAFRSSGPVNQIGELFSEGSGPFGEILKMIREPGGVTNFVKNWWGKTKEGLNSSDDTTVWMQGLLGLQNPWSKQNVARRDLSRMYDARKEVESQQTIDLRTAGMDEKQFYQTVAYHQAKKYGVDPYQIAAIMKNESNFRNVITEETDEKGVKQFGAVGPMQLRLTAMKEIGLDPLSAVDPRKNIEGGIRYYKQLLDQFNGNTEQALIAYKEGPGFLKSHFSQTPQATYQEGGKTITDQEKYLRGAEYARKAMAFMETSKTEGLYGKLPAADFVPRTKMTKEDKDKWETTFKGHREKTTEDYKDTLENIKDQAEIEKAEVHKILMNKEERKQFELEIDKKANEQIIAAKRKYIEDYQFLSEEEQKLDEGKGTAKDPEEKAKQVRATEKVVRQVRRELAAAGAKDIVLTATEQAEGIEQARLKEEQGAAQTVASLQVEYNERKKLLDLQLQLGLKPALQSYDEETTALDELRKAEIALIDIQLQKKDIGHEAINLEQKKAQLLKELEPSEVRRLTRVKEEIKDEQDRAQRADAVTTAYIAYNAVIADPAAMEALERRLEISKLLSQAYIAEKTNQKELADVYRKTAAVLKESLDRGDFWGGITDGLDATVKAIGSTRQGISKLVQGIGGDMKSSMSDALYSMWKGDFNPDKERQLYDVGRKLDTINAQKEQIKLQKDQISSNNSLSSSEKEAAQTALDAKLKQLEVEEQLAQAQKTAAENSKGAGEIWQGFLDSITKKATDFMADEAVKGLFGFLSGETKQATSGTGKNIFSRFIDWITGAQEEVKTGMDSIASTVEEGMANTSGAVESGGSGIAGSFSNIFSGLANVAKGWMETIYKYVVDYLKQIMASLASSGFGGLFGGGEGAGESAAEGVGEAAVDSGYWHKGGYIERFHKGGSVLRYHAGGLKRDEVPIVAQKGEYVLSKQDVDFVNKVKSGGVVNNININSSGAGSSGRTTIVPLGVTVMVDNQSSALLQATARARQSQDEQQQIIDVVLKNINSRGALGGWR